MKEIEIIRNKIDNKKLKKVDLDRFLLKFEEEYEENYLMPDFIEESLKWIKISSYLLELLEKKIFSFSSDDWKIRNLDFTKLFRIINEMDDAARARGIKGKSYPYFKKFPIIINYLNEQNSLNLSWVHIDLLFLKHTKQSECLKKFGLSKTDDVNRIENEEIRTFVTEQFNAVRELLASTEPVIIIVVNAKASRLFKIYFGSKWMSDVGCYTTEICTKQVQTHLTGMLTGQRALDNESFKSLIWQINNAFSIIKKNQVHARTMIL